MPFLIPSWLQGFLVRPWGSLGNSWEGLEAVLGFGELLGPLGTVLGRLGNLLAGLGRLLEVSWGAPDWIQKLIRKLIRNQVGSRQSNMAQTVRL